MDRYEAELRALEYILGFVDQTCEPSSDFFEYKDEVDGKITTHFTDEEIRMINEQGHKWYSKIQKRINWLRARVQ